MDKLNKQKENIWIITELFYPDETSTAYILTKVANKLSEKYNVNVICSDYNYNTPDSGIMQLDGKVKLHRLRHPDASKKNLLRRLWGSLSLSLKFFFLARKKIKKEDKVLVVTNPVSLILTFSFLKRFKKYFYSILVHDVFPENTIPAGIIKSRGSFLYRIVKWLFDKAYSNADMLIVLGRDMKEVMLGKIKCNKKTKVRIIENWADTDMIKPLENSKENPNPKKNIIFQYAGNIGRAQGLNRLVDIITKSDNEFIKFDFWGDGVMRESIEDQVKTLEMQKKISFFGKYARKDQNEILNSCDMAIVIVTDGMYGLGVPSKSYNIMAAGKPILFIGDSRSEIALVLKEHDIGICFEANDIDGLKEFFRKVSLDDLKEFSVMGKKARDIAEKYFSEDVILDKFADAFEEC